MSDPDDETEEIPSYQDNYPYFASVLTTLVVFFYAALSLLSGDVLVIAVAFVSAGVYFWALYATKVRYDSGSVSRGFVYFVSIGGMFLLLLVNVLLCVPKVM